MRDFQDKLITPPKPASRPEGASVLERIGRFRRDMFSSQPERLYRAKMARMRAGPWRSFFINTVEDAKTVLHAPADDYPKSRLVSGGLRDLLGASVFVTNGADWARARRLIDPVFANGQVKASFPQIVAAGEAAIARLKERQGPVEIEADCTQLAADVIFRLIFSRPITDAQARSLYDAFQRYQRTQPLWNLAELLRLPPWVPRLRSRETIEAAQHIRALLGEMIDARCAAPKPWPDDLLSGLLAAQSAEEPGFTRTELIDQIAIFFLAGHETSASALAWGLYMLALDQSAQARVASEAAGFEGQFAQLSQLGFTRNVFRETLRLYPPVPMMLRDAARPRRIRGETVGKGALVILSPWHLGRHELYWEAPDAFDPDRWDRAPEKGAFLPFSAGPRVCAGAGLAMAEGVTLLAMLTSAFELHAVPTRSPMPVAHLTLRAKDGIWLELTPRKA